MENEIKKFTIKTKTEKKEEKFISAPEEKGKIYITGTKNRYDVKKLLNLTGIIEEKIGITENHYLSHSDQYSIITNLKFNFEENKNNYIFFIKELTKKLYNYKRQDIIKESTNQKIKESFIDTMSLSDVIEKLYQSNLVCNYCGGNVLIMFSNKREMMQWSLDRIDNLRFHSNENTVISCLGCNLERKNKSKQSFEFQKNIKHIVKVNLDL